MAVLIIAAVFGFFAFGIGGIWLAIIAFRESAGQGVLCLLVPFYALYYAITRWAEAKKPFVISLIGLILFIGGLVPHSMQFKSEAEPVIAGFMEAGAAGDVDQQYSYWHRRAGSKEELAEFLDDNRTSFSEYKDMSTSSWSVETEAGITEGYVTGSIIYTDGTRCPFEAWLIKENDVWKLTRFEFGTSAEEAAPASTTERQSPYTAEELRQIEEHEFLETYSEMRDYIQHVHTLALELQGFSWHQFADVGWYEVDKYGVQKWTLLQEVLPSAGTVQPLATDCDQCLALATEVWSENPYKEPQTPVQEMERLTIPEWRQLCGELQTSLAGIKVGVENFKADTESLFSQVEAVLSTERAGIKEKYLENFQIKSAEYTDLLDEVIDNLQQAEQLASRLRDWQFGSLTIDEG